MELQEIKRQYKTSLNMLNVVRANTYKLIDALQQECSHPIDEVEHWEKIPMGQVKGDCGCCGAQVWYHEYSAADQSTMEFTFKPGWSL
jgi:hypothetical protein